jgi:hypothetical protein
VSAFAATSDGRVVAHFDESETRILLSLSYQFSRLLDDTGNPSHLVDPAMHRLFPDAYRDDSSASDEFRRYTQRDLAIAKVEAAEVVQAALSGEADPPVDTVLPDGRTGLLLGVDASWSWLRHLTDLRLTLAARMGVVDDAAAFDEDPAPDASEDDLLMRSIFDWVGYVQELLISAVEEATAGNGSEAEGDGDDSDSTPPGPASPDR